MIIKLLKHKQKCLQSKYRIASHCTEKVQSRIWWPKLEHKRSNGGGERDQAMEQTQVLMIHTRRHNHQDMERNTNKIAYNLSLENQVLVRKTPHKNLVTKA
jgi:hypothetical protein